MNTLQHIESIQQVFPKVSRNQIRLDLDVAQKLIVANTGSVVTIGSLTAPTANVAWSLPTGFVEFIDFLMYDTDYNPVYLKELNYKFEIENDKFFVYSITSTPITGLDCVYAQIVYKALPTALSAEATAMEVEEYYRDAVESYVLSKYFSKFPIPFVSGGNVVEALNFQAAAFHKQNYNDLRIQLKREINSRQATDNEPLNYDSPGKYYLPRRPGEAVSASTVTVGGLSELYTKFAYYKITSGTEDGVSATLSLGYSTISCSVTSDTITVSSTAEFDAETIILPNNWDATWVRNSSSEIVITAPSGWDYISFEIYERD